METLWKIVLAIFGGAFGFLVGGWTTLLQILLAFMVIDQITGLIASYIEGKLSSKVGFKGIAKKVIMVFVVVVAHFLDEAIGTKSVIRDGTIFFYLGNELLSFIENAGRAGVKLPTQLVNAVAILKGKGDGKQ
jgi:toxin secretion/phage lysis holin